MLAVPQPTLYFRRKLLRNTRGVPCVDVRAVRRAALCLPEPYSSRRMELLGLHSVSQ